MGTTPVYGWPYPDLNNIPDGATQMKNLALAIEPKVKANADATTTNSTNITANTNAIAAGLTWAEVTSATSQALTGSLVLYPMAALTAGSAAGHITGGKLVIDVAGTYLVSWGGIFVSQEAANAATAACVNCYLFVGGTSLGGLIVRGCSTVSGSISSDPRITPLAAGATVETRVSGVNLGTSPTFNSGRITVVRIGP